MFVAPDPRLNESSTFGYNPKSGKRIAERIFGDDFARYPKGGSDMDVRSLGSAYGAFPVRSTPPVHDVQGGKSVSKPVSPKDELNLSAAGKMLDHTNAASSDLRQERIACIRAEIEAGTYDTDDKLEIALSKMLGTLGFDLDDE